MARVNTSKSQIYGKRTINFAHKPSPANRSKSKTGKDRLVSGALNKRQFAKYKAYIRNKARQDFEEEGENAGENDDGCEGTSNVVDGYAEDVTPENTSITASAETTVPQIKKRRRKIEPSTGLITLYQRWIDLLPHLVQSLMDVKAIFVSGHQPDRLTTECLNFDCSRQQRTITFLSWNGELEII